MSTNQYPDRPPERPRSEPEIIPPGADDGLRRGPGGVWMRFEERDGVHRIYIARPGLPSIVLGLLLLGLIVAAIFLVLAGIVLVWLPIVAGGIVLALLAGTIRYRWRQLQSWWSGGGR